MIIDPAQVDGQELRCQICIIGSGAAGITLALELDQRGFEVLLVAGGGHRETAADRSLNQGTIEPAGSHEPLEENRHRAFGGGTKIWGGRLVPFESIDFDSRSFVPLSGWPIAYEDVARYFPRAAQLSETNADDDPFSLANNSFDLPGTFGHGHFTTTTRERWSMPTDFATRYGEALGGMDNVRVLLDYHAVELRLDDDLTRVAGARLVSRVGRPLQAAAETFVLATGSVENARLLLASRNQLPGGVANHNDMVGRCYMSHIAGTHGWLTLNTRRKPAFYRFAKDRHGAYYRRRIRLSDEAQRELQVMNVIGFPHRPPIHDPSHGDAVLSLAYLQNVLRPPAGGSRPTGGSIGRHVANVAFANPAAWLNAARQFWLRTRRPRLPFVLPYNARAQDAFAFQAEHAPNPESRVRLSRQRDEFGVPRIEPQVRFSEIDFRTVTTFYRELDRALRADQLGCLEYDPVELDEHLKRITTHFDSIAHQLGTTRMSSNPKLGVVDPDCRAHSVANLYLAGGSVFPTSGHANPTLTIVALTLRLVDHLAGRFAPMRLDQAGGSAPAASGLA